MSPEVNLDLEDVPFAILEVVKARILANRARIGQTRPRPSTRPRPQFRKTGASSKGWRKPQNGAGVPGGDGLLVAGAPASFDNVGLPPESSFSGASRFGLYAASAGGYRNFVVGAGPAGGAMSLSDPSSNDSNKAYGFCFASNFATSLDLASCISDPDTDDTWIGDLEVPNDGLISPAPVLLDPSSKASNYNSFTFEFFVKRPTFSDVNVSTHNFRFSVNGVSGTTSLRLAGITSFAAVNGSVNVQEVGNEVNGNWSIGDGDTEIGDPGQWFHVAYCKDDDGIRVYIKGRKIATSQVSSQYWNRYVGFVRPSSAVPPFVLNGSLPVMFALSYDGSSGGLRPAIHGIRWTPSALYTGDTFTPPTSITDLE